MIRTFNRALLLSGLLLLGLQLSAEGIRQVAPTAADAPVMLETGRENFGNFASPRGDANSRLNIFVGRSDEIIYLGLAPEYDEDGDRIINNTASQYRFQIRRATGNTNNDPIVHGPFTVGNNTANVNSWEDALFGNYDVSRTDNGELVYVFSPGEVGNYYIEFFEAPSAPDGFSNPQVNIPFWDFTVVHDGAVQEGRVWSRNWAFRTPLVAGDQFPECVWDREFNGQLYSYTEDGFVSRINFENAGMQGLSFNVAFNSTGPGNTGELTQDRMSIPGQNSTDNSAQHQIFLSEPDPAFFLDGECGQVNPATTFRCMGEGSFCLDVSVTKPGQVEVVIDFNRNGTLDDNSQDVALIYEFTEEDLSTCILWDGLRGDSTPIDFGDTIDLIINYSQGIQHWSVYDLEFMENGFCVETIRPKCAPEVSSNLLFWDDRNILEDPGTGASKDQRSGCECTTGCRSWNNFTLGSENDCNNFSDEVTMGYGDKSTLNTWWYANSSTIIRANVPLVRAFISGPDSICVGESTVFTALDAGATQPLSYEWSGPGVDNFSSPAVTASLPGTYCVTITDALGCSSNTCKELTVLNADALGIEYPESLSACQGELVTLSPSQDPGMATFSWEPAALFDDPTIASPSFTFTEAVVLTVTITSPEGCTLVQTINVTPKQEPSPSFTTTQGCEDGLEIQFNNTSTEAISYSWDFGDPNTTDDTSNAVSPSYTYSQPGTYIVSLTATSADGCMVETTETITVSTLEVIADFDINYQECTDNGSEVQFVNTSSSDYEGGLTYEWTFTNRPASSLENPVLNFLSSQTITVTLTVTTDNGCVAATVQEDIFISVGPPADQFPETLIACRGEETPLVPAGNPGFTYSWSPTTGIDLSNPAQPVFSPTETTTYTVVVSTGIAACDITETIEVIVPPAIGIEITGDGTVCTPTTTLTATTDQAATIQWLDPVSRDVLASGNTYTVDVSGVSNYIVLATDVNGCEEQAIATVGGGPVDVEVPDTVAVCFGEEILLNVSNLDDNDILSYNWTPAELFAAGTATDAMPNYLEVIGVNEVSVVVSNQFDCTTTENVHIAVINPNIDLSFTSMIDCNGSIVSFTNTSSDAFGYVWNFGDGSAPSYEVNPTHAYPAPGNYTVTLSIVYDVDCVEDFSQVITVEEPQIAADFSYDITECAPTGATIQFMDETSNTLNNTNSWNWTFETASPASSSMQNPSVTVEGSGPLTVQLIIGTANNCSDTIRQVLDIQLVDLDIALEDTLVVCQGETTVLNPNGDPEYIYSWTPAAGLDDPTAVSPTARPTETTTYYATAYNTVGADTCFVTDSVVLFVPPSIDLGLDQEPILTTCGEDVVVTATASVDVDVVWTNSGGTIGTGPVITLNPFRRDTVTATATDEYGCSESAQIIILDNGVDIEIEGGQSEVDACTGVPSTLSVINLDSDDLLSYEWVPAEFIDGPTDQSSAAVLIEEPGMYTIMVFVENQNDCRDTLSWTINARDFQATVPDTVFACHDTATELNPGGNTTYTYTWSPATGLSSNTVANPTATLTNDQLYFVTITDPATSCTNVDSLRVIVYPDINLMAMGDTVLCDPTPAPLSATTDIPTDIVWTLNGVTFGTGSNITFTPTTEGANVITVTATDAETGCVETAIVTVTYDPLENVIPESPVRVCPGEPAAINPNGDPDLRYEWAPADEAIDLTNPWNPVVTTSIDRTYMVTVTDEERGCTIIAEIDIEVEDAINLNAEPEVSNHCGGELTLTATTEIEATINWFLLPDNTPLGSGNELSFVPPLGTSQVYAEAVSAANCTERDTVLVNNYPIDASITTDLLFCEPTATTELTVINNDPAQELSIVWEPTGVLTDPATGSTVVVDPNVTDVFTATVTNQFGCEETLNSRVTVIDLEGDLSISADPIDFLLGESTTISVSGCDNCTYEWFPPTGETVFPDDESVVTTTPNNDGDLTYTVIVGLDGCEQELSITLSVLNAVCDVEHLFFPNAFTPNNDGDNDVLRLRSNFLDDLIEVEWMVYDRWGEEIFRTTDPRGEWDGTFRGEQLAPDVYGYWLRIVCPDEEELIQKGNVTILR